MEIIKQTWDQRHTNNLITEFTQCGLRLRALLKVGNPLSLNGSKNELKSTLYKWPLYLQSLSWTKNSKLNYKNGHHRWICGTKSSQITINLTHFWHCQNLELENIQDSPKYSFLEMSEKSTTRMKILSTPLRSLQNSVKMTITLASIWHCEKPPQGTF